MRIKMLETRPGSRNGSKVETFEAGGVYDLSHNAGEVALARVFVTEKWAREVEGAAETSSEEVDAPAGTDQFNPETADIELVKAFLKERGEAFHANSGAAKLRSRAAALLAAG